MFIFFHPLAQLNQFHKWHVSPQVSNGNTCRRRMWYLGCKPCLQTRQSTHATWRISWWRHQMETFSALLTICAGNSPVTGEFPAQRPVTRSFDVFFNLRLNKRLTKQSWGWWFETPSRPLWRHDNVSLINQLHCWQGQDGTICLNEKSPKSVLFVGTLTLCQHSESLMRVHINNYFTIKGYRLKGKYLGVYTMRSGDYA